MLGFIQNTARKAQGSIPLNILAQQFIRSDPYILSYPTWKEKAG